MRVKYNEERKRLTVLHDRKKAVLFCSSFRAIFFCLHKPNKTALKPFKNPYFCIVRQIRKEPLEKNQ